MPSFPVNPTNRTVYVTDGNAVERRIPHIALSRPVDPPRALEEVIAQNTVIAMLPGKKELAKGAITTLATTPNPADMSLAEILDDATIPGVNAEIERPVFSGHKLLHMRIVDRADAPGKQTTEQRFTGCAFMPGESVGEDNAGDRLEYSIVVCGEVGARTVVASS